MQKLTTALPTASSTPDKSRAQARAKDGPIEMRPFHHDAYRVLGENYLIRRWLPLKGPYFIALVQALRVHVYWNYRSGQQQTRLFPEAETIAQYAGMSRTMVFKLLRDPDMMKFVRRVQRRRYDAVASREVQTSNLYYVMMEDPPIPADEHLIVDEQRRIDAIMRGEDPDAESSEYTSCTLNAVHVVNSHSRTRGVRDNRIVIPDVDEGDTSIGLKGRIAHTATGNDTVQRRPTNEGRRESHSVQIEPCEADRNRIAPVEDMSRRLLEQKSEDSPQLPTAALLSEGAAWRVDAEREAGFVIESILQEIGDLAPAAGRAAILSVYQQYCPPVKILVDLARHAKRRVQNKGGHIDSTAPGYYIRTMQNLAREARREGWDVGKLVAKWERKSATPAQRPPVYAPPTVSGPRQTIQPPSRAGDHLSQGNRYADPYNVPFRGR